MLSLAQMGVDYILHKRTHNIRRAQFLPNTADHVSVENKIVIVTGANSGIGKHTALELARRGATVIMACRDSNRANEARQEILKEVPNATLEIFELDLGDLNSVRSFVAVIKCKFTHIDILINNAGISNSKIEKTKHGFESNMGVNHLGPFLLTLLLLDHLKKAGGARIISVSSSMFLMARLNLDDLMLERQSIGFLSYEPYSNSKLANALFIKELAKRLTEAGVDGINCYAVCPGLVYTNVFRSEPWYKSIATKLSLFVAGFEADRGCETILYCALSKSIENENGRMYRFLARWDAAYEKFNVEQCAQLWVKSEELVGLPGFSKLNFPSLVGPGSVAGTSNQ